VNTPSRLRAFVLTLPLAAPLLLAVAGCGGGSTITDATPDAAVKESESHYEAEIAKSRAAAASKRAK
jgi:anti-sigma factor RsiW